MPATLPQWQTNQELQQTCPRNIYTQMVLKVCEGAEQLVRAVLRRSWHGEREEMLAQLRQLKNTRPPADLSNEDRQVLAELCDAIGSTDPDAGREDVKTGWRPERKGLIWNVSATWKRTPAGEVTTEVEHGEMEKAVIENVRRAREHFKPVKPAKAAASA